MNEQSIKAQIRAAAWALVALVGTPLALFFMRKIIEEIEKEEWGTPGSR